jgi:hypothetical protein
MLSDRKIWNLLGDVSRPVDEDVNRLMLIELFSRLKVLEEENLALRVLLMESKALDEELFQQAKKAVREFLAWQDEQKARESEFFARSGIPFPEWVNFKLSGSFSKDLC